MRKVMFDVSGQVYVFPSVNLESLWAMVMYESLSIRLGATINDPIRKELEYTYPFWNNVRAMIWEKYGMPNMSGEEIKEFINKVLKVAMSLVASDVAKWILDDLYDRIFGDKFSYDYRKQEFLEDTTIVDVNHEIDEMMTDFIGLGIYLPYIAGVFDMNYMEEVIRKYGVEAYLDKMEEKLSRIAKGEVVKEEKPSIEEAREQIIMEAKLHPVLPQELANRYGLTVAEVERILKNAGAIYDPTTGMYWIPNSEDEKRAFEYLKEYAITHKTFKLGFDEAKRVLVEHGYSEDKASALIVDLASKGVIMLNNGIVTIPQVKAEVLGEKVASGGSENPEQLIDELTDEIVVEIDEGTLNFDGVVGLWSELAKEVNKTTFEKICRSVMTKLSELNPEKAKEFRAWLRDEFGTYSCRKLYDLLKGGSEEAEASS